MSDRTGRPWFETAFGLSYPQVYAHRDADEARRCLDLACRLLPAGRGMWLDLGCGQGRHVAELAGRDRPAVGLDLSATLLTQARRDSADAALVRADMRQLPLRGASCGAVLSLFTTFGYFGSVAAHAPVVAEIARVLVPGGAWLLDYLDSERVANDLADGPLDRRRLAGPLAVSEERRLAADPRRVLKHVVLEARPGHAEAAAACGVGPDGVRYDESVTLFTLDELSDLTRSAGLRLVGQAGSYDGGPLRPGESDRWLLVYERPADRKDAR